MICCFTSASFQACNSALMGRILLQSLVVGPSQIGLQLNRLLGQKTTNPALIGAAAAKLTSGDCRFRTPNTRVFENQPERLKLELSRMDPDSPNPSYFE